MIKISKIEKSRVTGKPVKEDDLFLGKDIVAYFVGEITKVSRVEEECLSDGDYLEFFDSKGSTFTVGSNFPWLFTRSACTIGVYRKELLPEEYQDRSSILCADPRVVWIALLEDWVPSAAYRNGIKTTDKIMSEILTDLLPSYDEAVEFLKKNKFQPFVSRKSDFYSADKEKGQTSLSQSQYIEKYGDFPIYPPEVDWSKYADRK